MNLQKNNVKQFQSNHTPFIDVASLIFTTHTVPYASTLTPAACTLKLNLENKVRRAYEESS